mmetsp:Transcript_2825/g.4271  ORF Transcript_2825/g.4271 Transcript_2825/m.4271 type:complete len:203 (+) Transcript_2825:1032-1640(+)
MYFFFCPASSPMDSSVPIGVDFSTSASGATLVSSFALASPLSVVAPSALLSSFSAAFSAAFLYLLLLICCTRALVDILVGAAEGFSVDAASEGVSVEAASKVPVDSFVLPASMNSDSVLSGFSVEVASASGIFAGTVPLMTSIRFLPCSRIRLRLASALARAEDAADLRVVVAVGASSVEGVASDDMVDTGWFVQSDDVVIE